MIGERNAEGVNVVATTYSSRRYLKTTTEGKTRYGEEMAFSFHEQHSGDDREISSFLSPSRHGEPETLRKSAQMRILDCVVSRRTAIETKKQKTLW